MSFSLCSSLMIIEWAFWAVIALMNWFTFSNEVEAHCNVASTASFTLVLFISTKSKSSSKLGQKLKQKILRELLMQNSDFWGAGRLDFRDNILDNCYFFALFGHFWGVFLCFCKKIGLCDDGRIAWWYGIEQKVGFAFACMLSTIRHLRRRERGDGGQGYCLRYWEGVTACTCLKRREK